MKGTYVGKPYKSRENGRFLTGKRRYVDDVKLPDTCSRPGTRRP
jgi:CO/xanthine dehydrogenase Mo-binding subunit